MMPVNDHRTCVFGFKMYLAHFPLYNKETVLYPFSKAKGTFPNVPFCL